MKTLVSVIVVAFAATGLSAAASADEGQVSSQSAPVRHQTVVLGELLEAVARKNGKQFLVDHRAPTEVVVGTVRVRDVDYPMLLSVLRNNGLAAAESDDRIKIVPVNSIRQHELPVLHASDDSISDDAWVTRLVRPRTVDAVRFVPLLRPMIQQAGHLVAHTDSNLLIIVAPYGVTERLVEIIEEADERGSVSQASTP